MTGFYSSSSYVCKLYFFYVFIYLLFIFQTGNKTEEYLLLYVTFTSYKFYGKCKHLPVTSRMFLTVLPGETSAGSDEAGREADAEGG